MDRRLEGFQEREHTADWELNVWAEDLPGLFEQSARGMYALAGVRLTASPTADGGRTARRLHLEAFDNEALLVAFLSELLRLGEEAGLAFDEFDLSVEAHHLDARLAGGVIAGQDKEIKAVTFHNLSIRNSGGRVEVDIVFDV
jgi:SHS2 domain-containing protein